MTATPISRTIGEFEGVETRRFAYALNDGNTRAILNSLLFYRNGVVVQAIVVSNDEDDESELESVNRFLSSLKTSGQALPN